MTATAAGVVERVPDTAPVVVEGAGRYVGPLEQLERIARDRIRRTERWEGDTLAAVTAGRHAGLSWHQLGVAAGQTGEALRKRYGHRVAP